MTEGAPFNIHTHPVHLALGARVIPLPQFDGTMDWYERYGRAHADDGYEGRLVAIHTFSEPWDTWEMHPNGEELVACIAGTITLHQEVGDDVVATSLSAGDAVINPVGVWHTADVDEPCTALFITAGVGTEMRAR